MKSPVLVALLSAGSLCAAGLLLLDAPREPEVRASPAAVDAPSRRALASVHSLTARVEAAPRAPDGPEAGAQEVQAEAEESQQGVVSGRVALDGQPPPEGTLAVLDEGGARVRRVALDARGRFQLGVLSNPAELTFRCPSVHGRTLVPPALVVRPTASEYALDWSSRHVNLKVVGDPGGWNRARIRVEGPNVATELETDDEGRAGLIFVTAGVFQLTAEHPSGQSGRARLELAEDAELESLVIRLEPPAQK